ncbi:hypothetical protein [Lysobacter enzymogenes]|uniref:hypothetical protein n=1 Tax=Lysobacter enzymogenes TaxID=69 RepID=UPI0019D135C3|nr:hypothetical protein [Lysobacter enzymogenes]
MDIASKHVYQALDDKGVRTLHHANSVLTACQFLRSKSLMSRGTVERLGIKQTEQSSDRLDKSYGIWFDVFADSVDIHARAKRANAYAPVLFEFDSKIIEKTYTGRIWVTKLNPTKWANKSDKQRWFQDKDDLEQNFVRGQFDQMVVLRHCGGEFPFKSYLNKIVLDDPQQQTADRVDLYSSAYGALYLAMSDSGLDVPIEKRVCTAACQCKANYGANRARCRELFSTRI